ncbi:NnrS family protein [Shumkonia mesophila]|uniref:NnrS family protein n=1 Tax=Shumkonia mesophila TaxID=2838854 RepID=UPI002935043F|nr:NnrS family protein [Shumkonia mesophila]
MSAPSSPAPSPSPPGDRPAGGVVFFAHGFRPFFLAAAAWALAALVLWLAVLTGAVVLPSAFDAVTWHAHEMLFGFVFAAVAGFLLTAVPSWTGRPPLNGLPLALLALLWVGGRVGVAVSAVIGPLAAALIDLALPAALVVVIATAIVGSRNWRNLPMAAGLIILAAANGLFHAEALGWADTAAIGWRLAIAMVTLMIGLIGGRIVPSFTRNWLTKRGESALPAPFSMFDGATLAATVLWAALWTALPDHAASAVAALIAGVLHGVRLARWRGWRTGPEPLVWVLHLGYLWVPVGLLLVGAAGMWPAIPASAAIHALTAGAMATMILAVMTRATLGHTGRALTAGPATAVLYAMVIAVAPLRIAAPLAPDLYWPLLVLSGLLWTGAFAIFLAVYGPMAFRPRVDGTAG